ncbi:MAG: hypothetical protein DWP97_06220 [Calditrichaeota bacterium]|nr:MAG: hypothetical protein DWP97_06220 [Calditrichota bacterium]
MKKVLVLIMFSALFVSASASASGFGSLQTATTGGMGKGNFMGSIGVGDATTFSGIYSYGLSANTDGRLKLGLIDGGRGSDANLMFGADFKYNIVSTKDLKNGPFDMAVGGLFEYYDDEYGSMWMLGGQFIGSYPFIMENQRVLSPYGRINVRIESISDADSELEIGFNAGIKWELSNTIDFFGEIQIDNIDNFYFGLDFNVM